MLLNVRIIVTNCEFRRSVARQVGATSTESALVDAHPRSSCLRRPLVESGVLPDLCICVFEELIVAHVDFHCDHLVRVHSVATRRLAPEVEVVLLDVEAPRHKCFQAVLASNFVK